MRQGIYVLDCHTLRVHIPTYRIQQNTKHTLLKYKTNALFSHIINSQQFPHKTMQRSTYFICYSQAIPAAAFPSYNLKFPFCENFASRIVRAVYIFCQHFVVHIIKLTFFTNIVTHKEKKTCSVLLSESMQ